jgi:hypothetical protein
MLLTMLASTVGRLFAGRQPLGEAAAVASSAGPEHSSSSGASVQGAVDAAIPVAPQRLVAWPSVWARLCRSATHP